MSTGQAKFISEAEEVKSRHTWASLNFLSTSGSCPDQSLSCVCLPWSSSEVLHRTKDMPLETGLKAMEFSSLPINPWCTTNDILLGWEKNLFYQTNPIVCLILAVSWCWLEFGDSSNSVGSKSASWLAWRLLLQGHQGASNHILKQELFHTKKISKIKNAFINTLCASLNSGSLRD